MPKRIAVYCGSSPGCDPAYTQTAVELAKELTKRRIGLVYGGSRVGLMGILARTMLEQGGEVIGVIPENLSDDKIAFTELSDLRIVPSLHARKAQMIELADGYIAMPGGFGTFEELFEALAWAQLGVHQNPCGLLNVNHYYDRLIDLINHTAREGFIRAEHLKMLLVANSPSKLLDAFANYTHPKIDKAAWVTGLNQP